MKNTFKKGLHPPGRKAFTKDCPIEALPLPSKLYVSLSQHIGKPAIPTVSVGDEVTKGQLIAAADGAISANVFAPSSGKVSEICLRPTAAGKNATHIVIECNGDGNSELFEPIAELTPEAIIDRIRLAGIVGMGGAGFPTAVKLCPTVPVDSLVINGAECEPYITCDFRIMLENTKRTVEGCRLLRRALKVEKVHIAIEDNKPEAIAALTNYVKQNNIDDVIICPLVTKYPQGGEKQLIYSVLKRTVPEGALPASVGVVVSNIHTALATYEACVENKPLTHRVVTVTGRGITRPANLWVPLGAKIQDVIDYLGGLKEGERVVKMLNGGPMMGTALSGGECSITKTSGCVLLMSNAEMSNARPSACINCGKCAKVCPMNLMPMYIDRYAQLGDAKNAAKYGATSCMECGCCAYTCPAKRTLVQSMRLVKKIIKEAKK